jgi:hypothetical protein
MSLKGIVENILDALHNIRPSVRREKIENVFEDYYDVLSDNQKQDVKIAQLQNELKFARTQNKSQVESRISDRLFHLTELLTSLFPEEFTEVKTDVALLNRRLLEELKERRTQNLPTISKERFLFVFKKVLDKLGESDEFWVGHDGVPTFAWDTIQKWMKVELGFHEIDDMRQDWIAGQEERLGIVKQVLGKDLYYGVKS